MLVYNVVLDVMVRMFEKIVWFVCEYGMVIWIFVMIFVVLGGVFVVVGILVSVFGGLFGLVNVLCFVMLMVGVFRFVG